MSDAETSCAWPVLLHLTYACRWNRVCRSLIAWLHSYIRNVVRWKCVTKPVPICVCVCVTLEERGAGAGRRSGAEPADCACAARPFGACAHKGFIVFPAAQFYRPLSFNVFFPEIPSTRLTFKQWVSVPLLAPYFL